MIKPKVSIIIPVYDVSKYLRKCLDSVINQILKEIEIIIINDCSPDPKDDEICTEYAKKDKRIVYVKHEKNLGLGGARNTGIEIAKAEYIGFVDSDDWISLNMYKEMHKRITESQSDIVCCNAILINEQGKQKRIFGFQNNILQEYRHMIQKGTIDIFNILNPAFWNKLWKKSLFIDNNIFFPELTLYEDLPVTPKLVYHANNICFISNSLYFYAQRHGSISNSMSTKSIEGYDHAFCDLFQFLHDENIYDVCNNHFLNLIVKSIHYQANKKHLIDNSLNIKQQKEHYINQLTKSLSKYVNLDVLLEQTSSKDKIVILEILLDRKSCTQNEFFGPSVKRKIWIVSKEISEKLGVYRFLFPFYSMLKAIYYRMKRVVKI